MNWIYYLTVLGIIFGLKHFASKAGADGLDFILSPTADWVEILTGLPFYKKSGLGYVSHEIRFIIAESCSGVQFLLITFATLGCSFVHRMKTARGRWLWLAASLAVSFAYTVFINGLRIAVSISLLNADFGISWLTPERLHTAEGAVIYLASLLVIYRAGEKITAAGREDGTKFRRMYKSFAPVLWYLLVTLALPLLNRAYGNDPAKFADYAGIILAVCVIFCIFIFTQEQHHTLNVGQFQ